MAYEPKNFDYLIGTKGFSEQLLKNHFTLYQGYVKNTNLLLDLLKKMLSEGKDGTPEFAELKRRFGFEFNGMRLHELYFGNMSKEPKELVKDGALAKALAEEFGSVEAWEKDFKATGKMRGVGWAILYFDPEQKRLFNVWINEHHANHPASINPLLVMDVWEHAFMLDYGINRGEYINAFFGAIDWEVVQKRFEEAQK